MSSSGSGNGRKRIPASAAKAATSSPTKKGGAVRSSSGKNTTTTSKIVQQPLDMDQLRKVARLDLLEQSEEGDDGSGGDALQSNGIESLGESESTSTKKEIIFPKSQYEYDRTLEPVPAIRGFASKIRDLISSEKRTSSAGEPSQDEQSSDGRQTQRADAFIAIPQSSSLTSSSSSATLELQTQVSAAISSVTSSGTATMTKGATESSSESRFKGIWTVPSASTTTSSSSATLTTSASIVSTGTSDGSIKNITNGNPSSVASTPVKSGWIYLHNEIMAYHDYVQPSPSDQKARTDIIETVRQVSQEHWPSCQTKVFGSVATGLCLPDSDVDLCVFGAPFNAIFVLSRTFKSRKMVEMIQVLDNAMVPIVKLRFNQSPFSADISFDQAGGIKTAQFIRRMMELMPEVKPLVLVVKHFLAQRDLNETYRGGMGSYLCFLSVLAVCQRARRNNPKSPESLGSLLHQYFDFYGNVLDYRQCGISLVDGGKFFKKSDRRDLMPEKNDRVDSLWLEDPMSPGSNIGSKAWKIHLVRHAFSVAASQLSKRINEFTVRGRGGQRISLSKSDDSILAAVIRIKETPEDIAPVSKNLIQFDDDDDDDDDDKLDYDPADLYPAYPDDVEEEESDEEEDDEYEYG